MNLLEWQAKRLLVEAGVRVPRGGTVVRTPDQARAAAALIDGKVMVKAQVPSGGRGKAGGVCMAADADEAAATAGHLLGKSLLGHRVHQVLVEEAVEGARELYLAVSVDFRARRGVLLLSAQGGIDVEALPADRLARVDIDPLIGWRDYLGRQAVAQAHLPPSSGPAVVDFVRRLYQVFVGSEATLVEVNPALLLGDGTLVAADARVVLDEAALARQPLPAGLTAETADDDDPTERIKRSHGFDYVELDPDGDIGLITTGAGGTMLTIDLIARAGGRPIDFVDVRTGMIGRDPKRLIAVLDELSSKPNLRVILVSVFGAITDLAVLAQTLLDALAARPPRVPVHVRLQGRNEERAGELLRARGVVCHTTLESAIAAVVGVATPAA